MAAGEALKIPVAATMFSARYLRSPMTIFGFNTDVKLADVVYHVQSEARQNDLLLQTLVFVKGQCVGKQAFSYAHEISHPGFSTEAMHELLKTQHKTVIDAIQQGQMSSVLGSGTDVQDVGGSGLSLQWKAQACGGRSFRPSGKFPGTRFRQARTAARRSWCAEWWPLTAWSWRGA